MRPLIFATLCLTLLMAAGCQEESPQALTPPSQTPQETSAVDKTSTINQQTEQSMAGPAEQPQQEPPTPPITEDFQGEPQLTLFPRVGDFRPAEDSDRLPYWNTFIDHLVKVTGVAEDQASGSRGWVFRSINSIDSVGYFSPLGVEPQTEYKVSFNLTAELMEGASAGVGIIEFNQFLWIPGQYTEEIFKEHFRGSIEGKRLTDTVKGEQTFTFTTGPETRMIHIVLFREGAHDRNSLMFDDIRIEEVKSEK